MNAKHSLSVDMIYLLFFMLLAVKVSVEVTVIRNKSNCLFFTQYQVIWFLRG